MTASDQRDLPAFRPEIQGVRAIAALLVATFHLWLGRVSGGVDVFIVVSGFLITTSLLAQAERHGSIQFARFWGRLAKRLLPAAITVVVAIIVASVIWLPKIRWGTTIREVVASLLYVENWQLAFSAVDYLDRENEVSPLQHYWALSVQGQFYLLWPLMVSFAIALAGRMRASVRGALLVLLSAVFLGSLAYSVVATSRNQPFAYFNSFARVWEFAAGGLLAIVLPSLNLHRFIRLLCGWIGLLAMLSCGLVLQVATVFPGYAALWPVLAAVLIIAAGTSGSRFGADRLLGSRPLAFVGDISYAIYLWHWPILVFYRLYWDRTTLSLWDGTYVLALSFGLAWLTTRLVETPIRRSNVGSRKPAHALLLGAGGIACALVVTTAWGAYFIQARKVDRRPVVLGSGDYPGAMAIDQDVHHASRPDVPPYPGPLQVKHDLPAVYADNCRQQHEDSAVISCVYGVKDAAKTIAIVGGSHSAQWLPALQILAEDQQWKLVVYTKSSCLLTADLIMSQGKEYVSCREWNQKILVELAQLRPDIVFTVSTTARTGGPEIVPDGFVKQWDRLGSMGIGVIAIRDNPRMGFEVSECVERKGVASPACSRSRAVVQAIDDPVKKLARIPPNVAFIDLTRYFCDSETCFPVAGNVLIYRDSHHITASYVATLAPALMGAIREVRPDL